MNETKLSPSWGGDRDDILSKVKSAGHFSATSDSTPEEGMRPFTERMRCAKHIFIPAHCYILQGKYYSHFRDQETGLKCLTCQRSQ